MWQKAGLIPSRPPVYHRLEKQPHTFTDNFEPPGSLRLRVSGLWGGSRRRATPPRGEHAKNHTQKTPPTDRPLCERDECQTAMWCQLPRGGILQKKGATVNLWRERVINLSEGGGIKRARTHGGGSDSSQFMGWSTYSFSHAPAFPCVGCNTARPPQRGAASPGGIAVMAGVMMRRRWVRAWPPSAINVPARMRPICHVWTIFRRKREKGTFWLQN